jgi:calcineurin-like phosphoesterase family protein
VNLSRWLSIPVIAGVIFGPASLRALQTSRPPVVAPASVTVRAIEPPATRLPEETASAGVTRFSFVAYGDTRSASDPNVPGDGRVIQAEHSRLVDRVISKARELASTPFPIRFVLQSGDAVLRGTDAAMWNVSFIPVIERLTRSANLPFFFAIGNHDVTGGEGGRALGLQNTLAAISKLIPAEGSARRLKGYPTYAFGYGNSFFIALDSNIPEDALQIAWVRDQLEHLDRARYRHLIVLFHHPAFSSGPHSRTSAPGSDQKLADRPEPQAATIRNVWLPLFRKHHVDLTITGHDHLFDHWVEHYVDRGTTYRMDHVVTGGGGAPIYTYAGEPDLRAYVTANAAQAVRLDHPMKPGVTIEANPHHFVTIRVDGDRLSLEVTGIGPADYTPYNGRATISLSDSST